MMPARRSPERGASTQLCVDARQARRLIPMAVVSVLLAAGLAACTAGPPPPGTGDPGNVRLHALRSQPILNVLPPGAKARWFQLSPPVWNDTYGGWSGLGVIERFTTTQTIAQVTSFYEAITPKYGWRLERSQGLLLGNPWDAGWSKRMRGGFTATMDIQGGGLNRNGTVYTPNPDSYDMVLAASAILKTPS